jgi:hypothetical protein
MAWTHVGLWRVLTDWLYDPQRQSQVMWKVVEVSVAVLVGLAIFAVATRRNRHPLARAAIVVAAVAMGTLVSWLTYEFILEPMRLAGPYWERTPVPGTTFQRW